MCICICVCVLLTLGACACGWLWALQNGKSGGPTFQYCHLTNVSYCPVTQAGGNFALVLYNGLGRARTAPVRVPLADSAGNVLVQDAQGNAVQSTILTNTLPGVTR